MDQCPKYQDARAPVAALTEQQHRFVVEFTTSPGAVGNASEAARRAGYSEKSAAEIGRKLVEKLHVQEAIREAQNKLIGVSLASKAIDVLRGLIEDETAHPKLRLEAAKTILDRAGVIAPRAPDQPALAPPTKRFDLSGWTVADAEACLNEARARKAARDAAMGAIAGNA
jgi:hypothetical protein